MMYLVSILENDLQVIKNLNMAFIFSSFVILILFLIYKPTEKGVNNYHNTLVIILTIITLLWSSSLIAFVPGRYEMFGTYSLIILSIASILYLRWNIQLVLQVISLVYIFTVYVVIGEFFLTDPIIPKITVILFLNIFAWGISRLLYYNNLENYQLNVELNTQNEIIQLEVDKKTKELSEKLLESEKASLEAVKSEKLNIELKEDLKLILNSTAEGIYGVDTKGNCTFINSNGLKILGYDNENELIGENIHNLIHHTKLNGTFFPLLECQLNKSFINGENVVFENDIIWTKDGSSYPVAYSSMAKYLNNTLIGAVVSFKDNTERIEYEKSLISLGYEDYLTKLYNRRYFNEKLTEMDIEENYPLAIIIGDINGLKFINDSFGHSYGDELLTKTSELLLQSFDENTLIARMGGDEFAIALPNTTAIEVDKILEIITSKLNKILINALPISIAFGYSIKIASDESISPIYKNAENIMYRDKMLKSRSMRSNAIETILNTLHEKDGYSETHSRRVAEVSSNIAKAYGMNNQEIQVIRTAGLLHDIGKIIIPSDILNKIGKLTKNEYMKMKEHPEIGFRLLNTRRDMKEISEIVFSHHERWDGKGYPKQLKKAETPIQSRIIAIADAYDAMTSDRTYKDKLTMEEALIEVSNFSGTQFDPELVKVFVDNFSFITKTND